MTISSLTPTELWSVFDELAAIPHPSGHEEAALQFLEKRLDKAGVEHWRDTTGNLMMRKPATDGCENAPGIVLQSHIDMVPQKADGVDHDFEKDSLKLIIEDGWVSAEGTTLGADNGIGVAAIIAAFESADLKHGPLEGLITIDEERGLVGAQNLQRDVLKGDILLNLDSEDEGELFVGCAGGEDFEAILPCSKIDVPPGLLFYEMKISGLSGGHSGIDIYRGRGNAIKILSRFLASHMAKLKLGVSSFDGGTLMNAIPRDGKLIFGISKRFGDDVADVFEAYKAEIQSQYKTTDPNLSLTLSRLDNAPIRMLQDSFVKKLVTLLNVCPSQTLRMNPGSHSVSETSNNLAVISTEKDSVVVTCMARSLRKSAQDDLVADLKSLFEMAGADIKKGESFSGWTPNPNSVVLEKAKSSYQDLFGKEAKINVIHAGLECGLLGEAYPNWDMISFGPTIKGAHSPDERVNIESVGAFWTYFVHVLKKLAEES